MDSTDTGPWLMPVQYERMSPAQRERPEFSDRILSFEL